MDPPGLGPVFFMSANSDGGRPAHEFVTAVIASIDITCWCWGGLLPVSSSYPSDKGDVAPVLFFSSPNNLEMLNDSRGFDTSGVGDALLVLLALLYRW